MMIHYSSNSCIQKSFLSDIKLIMVDQCDLLYLLNCPLLINIITKENQFRYLMVSKMHINIKLDWEEAAFAINHGDMYLLELQVVVVSENQRADD